MKDGRHDCFVLIEMLCVTVGRHRDIVFKRRNRVVMTSTNRKMKMISGVGM